MRIQVKSFVKSLGILTSLSLVSCSSDGDGNAGGGEASFTSVAGVAAPTLTTSQNNAVATSVGTAGVTGQSSVANGYSSGSGSLRHALSRGLREAKRTQNSLRLANQGGRPLPASDSFESQSFESEDVACDVSGTASGSGNFSGSYSVDENSFEMDIDMDLDIVATDCVGEEGSIDGTIDTTGSMSFDMTLDDEGNPSDASMSMTFTLSGTFTAQGEDDEGDLQNVEMTFSSLRIRLELDESDFEAFETLYDDSENLEDNIDFMSDNLQCSGSVTIDGTTLTCAQFFAAAIAEAADDV